MNGFTITPAQANVLIDKLYEILGRKNGVKIIRKKIDESENKKMCLIHRLDTSNK